MSDVTRILSQINDGDPKAAEQLLPLVYDELRKLAAVKLAQEKPGQTLQATALVHEAYMRLVGREKDQSWDSRGHFFAAAAEAMRRILIDQCAQKESCDAGATCGDTNLDVAFAAPEPCDDLLVLTMHWSGSNAATREGPIGQASLFRGIDCSSGGRKPWAFLPQPLIAIGLTRVPGCSTELSRDHWSSRSEIGSRFLSGIYGVICLAIPHC